jgi:hypothetical protein
MVVKLAAVEKALDVAPQTDCTWKLYAEQDARPVKA